MSTQSAYHSMYIGNDGKAYSFGYNAYSQLGYTGTSSYVPKAIPNMINVKAISEGTYHSMILLENGDLYSMGYNHYGQLGHSTGWRSGSAIAPIKIMTDVKEVACGYLHTIILKKNGDVYTCGYNGYYQLGWNGSSDHYSPGKVDSGVKHIGAGYNASFLIKENGDMYSAGQNNYGQLGLGNTTQYSTFRLSIKEVRQVDGGVGHTIVLKNDGTAWGLGYNYYGQTGNAVGNSTGNAYVTPVKIMDSIRSVACGTYFTGLVTSSGDLYTFGNNGYGQLALGNTSNINPIPRKVVGNVRQVAMGYDHILVLSVDGVAYSAGRNNYGQLGISEAYNTNVAVTTLKQINNGVRRLMGGAEALFLFANVTATTSFHKDDFKLTATIDHVSKKLTSYKISVNGVQRFPSVGWTAPQLTDFILNKDLPHTYFDLGTNIVLLELIDEFGATDGIAWSTIKVNQAPQVYPELSAGQIHKDNVTLGGNITDPDGDRVQYRVLLNNNQKYPTSGFTEFEPSPANIGIVLNNADFNVGANTLKIETKDDLGTLFTWSQVIIKTNTAPAITGTVLGNFINASVADADGDKVQYRIILNGEQLYPEFGYTGYNPVPLTIQYTIPRPKVKKKQNNIVRIETLDELGGAKSLDITFTGMFSGLLFCDATESFYSDDFGEVIKYLDFGTIVAGQTTAAERVYVKNTLGYPVDNVRLRVDNRELDGVNAKAEISKLDAPFEPSDNLAYLEQLDHNAKIGFYVRIATNRQAMWGGMFDILTKADPKKS
ncbi:RCC1 domain-containing protein [Paenibacillus sp. NPDC058177]|uniref:RCC1 domain-containing protein n=1 Tax=Paenibacillus sp. NPDC058177 TaxID=3346369 RepID=UPI0036D775F1